MVKHTPIPGFDGYAASEDGTIWSVGSNWRGKGARPLKAIENGRGYLKVRLETLRGRRNVPIHKLIALTFHGARPSGDHEVCHIDGNCHNNAASNLRWGTRQDNANDREKHGRTSRGSSHAEAIKAGLANARLIAAAPELLEALKLAESYLDAEGTKGRRHLAAVRAAIAKATGGDK